MKSKPHSQKAEARQKRAQPIENIDLSASEDDDAIESAEDSDDSDLDVSEFDSEDDRWDVFLFDDDNDPLPDYGDFWLPD